MARIPQLEKEFMLQYTHLTGRQFATKFGLHDNSVYGAINKHGLREQFGIKGKNKHENSSKLFGTRTVECFCGCGRIFKKTCVSKDAKNVRFIHPLCKNKKFEYGHGIKDEGGRGVVYQQTHKNMGVRVLRGFAFWSAKTTMEHARAILN